MNSDQDFSWRRLLWRLLGDRWIIGSLALALATGVAGWPLNAHGVWPNASAWLIGLLGPPLVMAVFLHRVDSLSTEREVAFWIRVGRGFLFLWLGTLMALWSRRQGVAPSAAVAVDTLLLFFYVPIGLAIDLRPHRQQEESPRLFRQLQLTGVFLLAFQLYFYVDLVPRWVTGGRLAAGELATVDLVFALLLAWIAWRRQAPRWRAIYGIGSLAFATLAAAHVLTDVAPPHGVIVGASASGSPGTAWLLSALAMVLVVLLARVRHKPFPGPAVDPVARRRLRYEVPLALSVAIVPVIHLVRTTLGVEHGPTLVARHWLVLVALAVMVPMAWLEYASIRRRSSFLELEHRRASEETLDREVYLDSLIEYSPLAIVVLDPQHRVRMCNPAFEKLFDYPSHEVVGSTLDRLISSDPQRTEASAYTQDVIEGRSVHVTTTRQRKDGTEVDVELYGVPLFRDTRLIGIFAIYQDVTDRLRAETALRDSEERFRRLSDASFEGIVVSQDEVIVDCNEQYARLVGMDPMQVIGARVLDLVHREDRDLVRQKISDAIEQPYEHRIERQDGQELVVEVHGRTVPHGGKTVRVTAVRDMTQYKRFEEQVRQSQKMEAVGRLAGGIAHDFNNLLTVIKGYAQLLSMQMDEGKMRGLVEEILQASERASLMTQRLLAFGRKQPLQAQHLDLNGVLKGMEKILRRLIRADIRFDIQLADDLGRVKADPSQMEQVVLNLVINAGDAMPSGGTLKLETQNVDIESESASVAPLMAFGSYVCLTVSDTGMGMDRSTLEQVFEPFFTTKAKGKGTGLGLATVYAIVKASSGVIDVESAPGEGTEFRVYLPRVPDGRQAVLLAGQPLLLPRGSETVLVVEDEPAVRALATEFLQAQGYEVIAAADGRRGLKCFEEAEGKIDLVLSDVVMPEMNGPQMVEQLQRRWPETLVLYMSGYTDEVLGEDDPALANLLVQKPFSVEELVIKVREVLDSAAT